MLMHIYIMLLRPEIDVWNGDPEHVIDVIPDFTRLNIEDSWNQARQLEESIVAEILDSFVCA